MSYLEEYNKWKNYEGMDELLKEQLDNMTEAEIKDAFGCELSFGTAGLRGVLGAGTNRMNYYIVRKASYGFGQYLETFKDAHEKGIVIAHDNRHYSVEFALDTARVFATMGFKVYLFSSLRPTPELSYAVRYYKAIGGVMITASHNPREYNGYKVYDENGCQLVPDLAQKVIDNIAKIDNIFSIKNDKNWDKIQYIDKEVDEAYLKDVQTIRINPELKGNFKVVYTPLHGTGQVFAHKVLQKNGFNCVPLDIQMTNDPDFSNVKTSNPEDPRAFDEAIELANKIGATYVLATDPDADRLGMGVFHNGKWELLNGNQSATMIIDYICHELKAQNRLPKDGWVFSTNVSSDLPLKIARKYGLKTYVSLTGFKFIGDQAKKLEGGKGTYVFGYEESYGCLVKPFVRDKDAIQAILMICEVASWCEKQGMDCIDYLNSIYEREGYYVETQSNIYLKGLDGTQKIKNIMDYFRNNDLELKFGEVVLKEDNLLQLAYEYNDDKIVTSTIDLPKSNVIKYVFKDESWVVLRPSGTEPKLKVYYGVIGNNKEAATKRNSELNKEILALIDKINK